MQRLRETLLGAFLWAASIDAALAYERIVSATGNASETIAEFGLSDKLVAVDTTSTLPKAIMEKKPKIGYRRRLSAEGILSMRPDLLILAPDAGPATVVDQIRAAGIKVLTIEDEKTVDGMVADIELLARKLHAGQAALSLIKRIREEEAAVKELIMDRSRQPNIAFLMDTGIGKFLALGSESSGDAMVKIVGGNNVFGDHFHGIKPASNEALIATDMDMIVIAPHGGKPMGKATIETAVSDYPSLLLTKAARKNCIFRVGTIESLGFGPTLLQTAKKIAQKANRCIEDESKGTADP